MSHTWSIKCVCCNAETRDYNHAREQLLKAVEEWPQFKKTLEGAGWRSENPIYGTHYDVGAFLAEHDGCGRLEVRSEYGEMVVASFGALVQRNPLVR